VALLSGIALCPELQDWYGRHSKSCDPVCVLRVCTSRLFGDPCSSRFPPVGSAGTVLLHSSLAGTLPAASAGTLLPLTIAGTSTAEWLPSLGNSPHPPRGPAIYSTVANLALAYAVSWYSTHQQKNLFQRTYRAPVRTKPVCSLPPVLPDLLSPLGLSSIASGAPGRPTVPPKRPTPSLRPHPLPAPSCCIRPLIFSSTGLLPTLTNWAHPAALPDPLSPLAS